METQTILTDERRILDVTYQDGFFQYGELGQGGYVPWFAVFVGDQSWHG